MTFINSFKELSKTESKEKKIKNILKYYFIKLLSKKNLNIKQGNIFYPFYHHVFNDETKNFQRQIKFLKNYGDFISYDDSIKLINEGIQNKDMYFCLSFDDGFKNIFENVTEILLKLNTPATFFLPTSFIDNSRKDSGKTFFNNENINIEFLNWADCRVILSEKLFTIGSHSVNHKVISSLTYEESYFEMRNSKIDIENKLSIVCNHFAPPLGNFLTLRDPKIARDVGYKSFSTTIRGKMNIIKSNIFSLKRDHFLANWDLFYLKYFLNK